MNKVKWFATVLLCLLMVSSFAQADGFLKGYFFRWENSKKYLLAVAEAMPDSDYRFKPVSGEMSFAEQLAHICTGIDFHAQKLINGRRDDKAANEARLKKFDATGRTKKEIIDLISATFDDASTVIKSFDPAHLQDSISYIDKTRTKQQIFLLLSDHITHHRAQTLVYLRLKGIKPPDYTPYQ